MQGMRASVAGGWTIVSFIITEVFVSKGSLVRLGWSRVAGARSMLRSDCEPFCDGSILQKYNTYDMCLQAFISTYLQSV